MPTVRTAMDAGLGNSQRAALPGVSQQEQRLNVSADMFGGAAAQQLTQAARQMDAASDNITRSNYYQAKQQRQNDALEATNLSNEMQRDALDMQYNPQSGFYAMQGAAAVGLKDTAMKKLQALRESYVGKASNPQAAALFEKEYGTYTKSVMESVSRYELEQTTKYTADTVASRQALNAEKVGHQYNDDQAFGTALTDNTKTVVAQASTEGWAPDKFREELWKSNSKLYHSRAYAMMNSQSPETVMQGAKFYQDAIERGDLTMEDGKSLDAMRDAAYPRALSGKALAEINGGTGSFSTMTPDEVFERGIKQQESGGRRYKADGVSLLEGPMTKYGTAKGEAQVLDGTNADPGFGVRPADMSGTPEQQANERARVGKDYFKAMTTRYGDMSLGALAYNWGPDNVDKHIAKMGDPTKGGVSMERFIASVPSKEAREYVPGVMSKLGANNGPLPVIDGGAASAKAAELDAQFPGAGADFLALVDKQNKTVANAKKASDDALVAEGATFMQESNGDQTSVPAALKAKLIAAGKWEDVAKYGGVTDRKTAITLDSMGDDQFAGVNLADYTLKLSATDMEARVKRQQIIRNGDEGYKSFSTQRSTYWMAIAGEEAGKSSEDKARWQEMTDRRFETFKKENKRAPNREEARVIFQSISSETSNGRLYNEPSDAKVLTDSGFESTDIERYNTILASNNFDLTEANQELMRTNPQAVIGEVPDVPSDKILPIVDRLTRGGLQANPQNVREYYMREVQSQPNILGLALDAYDLLSGGRTRGNAGGQ